MNICNFIKFTNLKFHFTRLLGFLFSFVYNKVRYMNSFHTAAKLFVFSKNFIIFFFKIEYKNSIQKLYKNTIQIMNLSIFILILLQLKIDMDKYYKKDNQKKNQIYKKYYKINLATMQ